MKTQAKIILAFIAAALFTCHIAADTFSALSSRQGLTDLMVSVIAKDKKGYIWIGASSAVFRFDGVRLRRMQQPPSAPPLRWVNSIVEVNGHKLVGCENGLYEISDDQTLQPVFDHHIKGKAVRSIIATGDGKIFLGTSGGLMIIEGGKIRTTFLSANHMAPANHIRTMARAAGALWLLTDDGEYRYDLESAKLTALPHDRASGAPAPKYRTALAAGDSTIYLGTMNRGLLKYDIPRREFSEITSVGHNVVMWLGLTDSTLYVGTDGAGVSALSMPSGRVIKSFRHNHPKDEGGLRTNSVYAGHIDHDSLLWVGLYQYGIDYMPYHGSLFNLYSNGDFSTSEIPVRSIAIRGKDKWIGSRNGLYHCDETTGRNTHFNVPRLRSDIISCIYDNNGQILIGTYQGGMYQWDSATQTLRDYDATQPNPFINGCVYSISRSSDGNLWMGTSAGVVIESASGRQRLTPSNSQLSGINVYDIFFDSTGRGWIATDKGLCIWNPTTRSIEKEVLPAGSFDKEKVSAVYEDSHHRLYYILHNGQLWTSDLQLEKMKNLSLEGPLSSVKVSFVVDDAKAGLWIGSNNGLFHLNHQGAITTFGKYDGVPSPIFLYCKPQYDASGQLWLGNSAGLISLRPDWEKRVHSEHHSPVITDVIVNGNEVLQPKMIKGTAHIDLAEDQDNITICFSDLSFSDPEDAVWEYRMEGKDPQWKTLQGKSEVTYYHLDKGKHVFYVRFPGHDSTLTTLVVDRHRSYAAILWWMCGIILACGIALALMRHLRRKAATGASATAATDEADATEVEKYKSVSLSERECRQLLKKLDDYMSKEKPFLDHNLKIADLAKGVGSPTYVLSYIFSQFLDSSYTDYVTGYRIKEFVRLVDEGSHVNFTLDSLMDKSGFSSRSSFFRHFKKAHGCTPSEYIKAKKGNHGKGTN